MAVRKVTSPLVPEPPGNIFSNCLVIGDQVFLAGMTASGADGKPIGGNDMAAQMRAVMTKIKNLLEAAGSDIADVVKVTTYVTDISKRPDITRVRPEFFSGTMPCSTLVEVKALAHPEMLIEIDAVAVIGAARPGQQSLDPYVSV